MHVLRSLAFYIAFYGASVAYVTRALVALATGSKRLRTICDRWSAWHHWCVENLLGIEVIITGSRHDGAALYAVKHESFFEAIEMPWLFDHPAGFAKQELFDIPGWGRAARAYGAIPVSRDDGAKALRTMLRDAQPYIAQQRPLVLFPEGTRVPHGEMPPLRAGFAALYKLLKIPVVPVAVDSREIYHRLWKQPGIIRIHFCEPILPGLPRDEAEARVHAAINHFNLPGGEDRA